MGTQETIDRVTALFEELGNLTPDGIYQRIKEAGIVGAAGDPFNCPLALFVARELGFSVMISLRAYRFFTGVEDWRSGLLPPSCREFVVAVDSRHDDRYNDIAIRYEDDE